MVWQIVAAIASSAAVIGVFVTAVAARSQANTAKREADRLAGEEKTARTEEITELRADHKNLADKVDSLTTQVQNNATEVRNDIKTLIGGQGEIKGSLTALLPSASPTATKE